MAIQTLFGAVPAEPNLLEKLKAGIQKTRSGLVDRLEDVLSGKPEIDAELLEELEYTLITADLGVATVDDILERIRVRVDRKLAADPAELRNLIREQLLEILRASETPIHTVPAPPAVVMVVGVNGAGKTTTIGKLAHRFLGEGRKVLLCSLRFGPSARTWISFARKPAPTRAPWCSMRSKQRKREQSITSLSTRRAVCTPKKI
jgi:fused signal recognition particle receptor